MLQFHKSLCVRNDTKINTTETPAVARASISKTKPA